MTAQPPVPPSRESMPAPHRGRFRAASAEDRAAGDVRLDVPLKFVTPVLGGGTESGVLDTVDRVRVPSIRGHLRFWWRALLPLDVDAASMRHRERALWGGMKTTDRGDEGAASRVAVWVTTADDATHEGGVPYHRITPSHVYASFSADDRKAPEGETSRRFTKAGDGLQFTLHVSCPADHLREVENAVRAWILFGGYGSRTRRGMGSLSVTADHARWLPAAATRDAIASVFGGDILAAAPPAGDTPRLAGAGLMAKPPTNTAKPPTTTAKPPTSATHDSADDAWRTILDLLARFRQGADVGRDPSPVGDKRLGQSRWPEGDKIRNLAKRPTAHRSRFPGGVVWPRAQFGLPIGGQFVSKDRTGKAYNPQDPGRFIIQWEASEALFRQLRESGAGPLGDRLASPLIVKALPLSDGRYAAVALWLNRGYPDGQVVGREASGQGDRGAADFAAVHAPNDPTLHLHHALRGKRSLREAFLSWLRGLEFVEIA